MKKTLAAVALILGGLAAFAGSPYPRPREVSAAQLAQWIKEHKPGLQIVDMRTKQEFDEFHVPASVWMPASVWTGASARDPQPTVIVTNDPSTAPPNTYVLAGGVDEWRKTPAVTRYFGGVRRSGC